MLVPVVMVAELDTHTLSGMIILSRNHLGGHMSQDLIDHRMTIIRLNIALYIIDPSGMFQLNMNLMITDHMNIMIIDHTNLLIIECMNLMMMAIMNMFDTVREPEIMRDLFLDTNTEKQDRHKGTRVR